MSMQIQTIGPLLSGAFVAWLMAALAIRFELYRMQRARLQGQKILWYARSVFWFAVASFTLGLALVSIAGVWFLYRATEVIVIGCMILFALFVAGGIIVALERPFDQPDTPASATSAHLSATSLTGSVAKTSIIPNIFFVIMLIYAISMITGIILWYTPDKSLTLLLTWPVLLLGLIIRALVLRRASKQLNQKRQALAALYKQPSTEETHETTQRTSTTFPEMPQLLTSPLTLRLKWLIVYGYLGLMAVFFFSYFYNATFITLSTTLSLIYFCMFSIPLLRAIHFSVIATSEGLAMRQGIWIFAHKKLDQHIAWQDARLFVRYPAPGLLGGRGTMVYELSNARQIVRWTHASNPRSFFTPWKIGSSTDEYDRHLQALCTYITTRTGLPLHDLSSQGTAKHEQELLVRQ